MPYTFINRNSLHLDPVLWIEIIEAKAQFVEFLGKVEIPQWLDKRHMDEEFEPAGISCCGELVKELSNVNHKRGENPGYS